MRKFQLWSKAIFAGAILITGAQGIAVAADDLEVVEAASVSNWTGFYVGAHGGAGVSKIGWRYQDFGDDASHLGNGFLGGVQAGYNAQFGNWVLGVEGDVAASGIAGSVPCPNPAFSCKSQIKWLGSLRLRVGYSTGNWLVYGTGGLGIGGVNIETTLDPVPGTFGTQLNRSGWAAGAGAEVALNDHWSLKGEFMHYDLGKSTHEVDFGQLIDVDTEVNTAKFGLNYRF